MTPRTVIVAMPQDMTVAEAVASNPNSAFSRVPIYESTVDHITGFVMQDEILLSMARDRGTITLDTLKREIATVPSSMPLSEVLEFLLNQRQHIALVIGEYGGTSGLVTLEDVVETLLGMNNDNIIFFRYHGFF